MKFGHAFAYFEVSVYQPDGQTPIYYIIQYKFLFLLQDQIECAL